jgi:hypothetical protein
MPSPRFGVGQDKRSPCVAMKIDPCHLQQLAGQTYPLFAAS